MKSSEGRWMKTKAVIIAMMLLVGLMVVIPAQQASGSAELRLQKIVLEPPSTVIHGEEVVIRSWVMNTGDRPADGFRVEFFYRLKRDGENWNSFRTVNIRDLAPSHQTALEVKEYSGSVSKNTGQLVFLDTAELELGTYEIRVVADSNNQIPEIDELNNELQTTLTLIPSRLGFPDLQPVGLSFVHPSNEEGGPVTVNVEISNTGDDNAGPFRVALLIGEEQFAEKYVVGLPAGDSVAVAGALDPYTLDLGPGTYVITALADADGQLEEQDEANNMLTGSVTIQELDLHPTGLAFDRSHVTLDGRVIVSAKLTNTGKGVAKTVEVGFYINNNQFAIVDVGPIGFGQLVTAVGELDPSKVGLREAPQEYEVRVVVDPLDNLHESDEANNALTKSLTILEPEAMLAELHPESLELNPPSPVELGKAEALSVCSLIKNTGKGEAEGFDVHFEYRVKGARRWQPVPCQDALACEDLSLEAGSELKAEGQLPVAALSPGIYEVGVAVDPAEGCNVISCSDIGEIEELDELNNSLVTTFTLLSSRLPDLSSDPMLGIEIAPSYMVTRRQTLRFVANVTNLGDLMASDFDVSFGYCRVPEVNPEMGSGEICARDDFTTFARSPVKALDVGKTTQAEAILETSNLEPGSYTIRIEIDPVGPGKAEGEVKEQNEANNVAEMAVLIQGADLTPISLSTDPSSPVVQGGSVSVAATVQNTGVEPTGKFDVSFHICEIDGEGSCSREGNWTSFAGVAFPGIAINNPEPAKGELDTSALEPGTYLLRVTVDPDDRAAEQSEANNQLTSVLVVERRLADLFTENTISFKPEFPVPAGRPVEILGTVHNLGGTAAQEFDVSFRYRRLEKGATYGYTEFYRLDSLELLPEEHLPVAAVLDTSELKGGTYEICIVADPESRVNESDETNNTYCIPPPFVLVSPPPDLQPEPVFLFDPLPPVQTGAVVRVTGRVTNTGGAPAEQFIVQFFYRRIEEETSNEPVMFAREVLYNLEPGDHRELLGLLDTKDLLAGPYEICIVVDADDFVTEIDEQNNLYCSPPPFLILGKEEEEEEENEQMVVSKVDLVASRLDIKAWPTADLTIQASVTVENRGEDPAGPFDVHLFYEYRPSPRLDPDPVLFASRRVHQLDPGERCSLRESLVTIGFDSGNYIVTAVVDALDTVVESDESNNSLDDTIAIP